MIGEDIMAGQYGWPIGMPLVRNLGNGLWEVRTSLVNRIARDFFVKVNVGATHQNQLYFQYFEVAEAPGEEYAK